MARIFKNGSRFLVLALPMLLTCATSVNAQTRVLAIGGNFGNQAADQLFQTGDLSGTITRDDGTIFNALTPDQLRTNYDVILETWRGPTSNQDDFTTRLLPFLQKGGGIVFEDNNNVFQLDPAVTESSSHTGGVHFTTTVAGLTNGVLPDQFASPHFGLSSWSADFTPFMSDRNGTVTGVYGTFAGGGHMVITGSDQDYHSKKGGTGSHGNGYLFLKNEINWASNGKAAVTPEGSSLAMLTLGVLPLAFGLRRKLRRA